MASLRQRFGESNLFSRLAWGLGLAFLALHLIYNARHAHERLVSNAETFAVSTIDRARAMAEVVDANPELLQRLSTPSFSVSLTSTLPEPVSDRWPHSDEVEAAARTLLTQRGEPREFERLWFEGHRDGRRFRGPGASPRLIIVLPHASGWLKVSADMESGSWRNPPAGAFRTTLLALLLFVFALWAARRGTRFLPRFAAAAERLGRGETTAPLDLQGPKEARRAARAFNEMQRRVTDHVAERTAMLGAFSHDLRTLATRISLRLESLPDGEQQRKAGADLEAMTRILDEALAFARDEASEESRRSVDLQSMLQTLIDDAQDSAVLAGASVATEFVVQPAGSNASAPNWRMLGQPLALRRAFSNIIDNAIKYGGSTSVLLTRDHMPDSTRPAFRVDVRDAGPGIPDVDHDRVRKPYVRLERSRNRDTGGTGLGLAIAANVIRRHAGQLDFVNDAAVTDSKLFQRAFIVRVYCPID
ncbi:MAG: ATP-binding protein [Pseudomonadales bacterium]